MFSFFRAALRTFRKVRTQKTDTNAAMTIQAIKKAVPIREAKYSMSPTVASQMINQVFTIFFVSTIVFP